MSTKPFPSALQLRDRLNRIIEQNPDAMILADVDGQDFAVLQDFNLELDSEGDARLVLRSYNTGDDVTIEKVK